MFSKFIAMHAAIEAAASIGVLGVFLLMVPQIILI
jgi:hypothetical protein